MAHREAVAQGGALGGSAMANRSCQAAYKARLLPLDGVDGALCPQALLQAQRESSCVYEKRVSASLTVMFWFSPS